MLIVEALRVCPFGGVPLAVYLDWLSVNLLCSEKPSISMPKSYLCVCDITEAVGGWGNNETNIIESREKNKQLSLCIPYYISYQRSLKCKISSRRFDTGQRLKW